MFGHLLGPKRDCPVTARSQPRLTLTARQTEIPISAVSTKMDSADQPRRSSPPGSVTWVSSAAFGCSGTSRRVLVGLVAEASLSLAQGAGPVAASAPRTSSTSLATWATAPGLAARLRGALANVRTPRASPRRRSPLTALLLRLVDTFRSHSSGNQAVSVRLCSIDGLVTVWLCTGHGLISDPTKVARYLIEGLVGPHQDLRSVRAESAPTTRGRTERFLVFHGLGRPDLTSASRPHRSPTGPRPQRLSSR